MLLDFGYLLEMWLTGFLIAGLAFVVTMAMRSAKASQRSLVRNLAFGALLVLPLVDMLVPGKALVLDSAQAFWGAPSSVSSSVDEGAPVLSPAAAAADDDVARAVSGAHRIDWPMVLISIWLSGAVVSFARIWRGQLAAHRLMGRARTCEDGVLLALLKSRATALDLRRPVRLAISDEIDSPSSWGYRCVTVVLPESMASWSADLLGPVLVHELAHVRRKDIPFHLMMSLARAVWWWNPVCHWLARAQEEDRELACDDMVLALGTPASRYAQILLSVAERIRDRGELGAAVCMARRSGLKGRLAFVLDPSARRGSAGLPGLMITALTSVSFAFAVVPDLRREQIEPLHREEGAQRPVLDFQRLNKARSIGLDTRLTPSDADYLFSADIELIRFAPFLELYPEIGVRDLVRAYHAALDPSQLVLAAESGVTEVLSINQLISLEAEGFGVGVVTELFVSAREGRIPSELASKFTDITGVQVLYTEDSPKTPSSEPDGKESGSGRQYYLLDPDERVLLELAEDSADPPSQGTGKGSRVESGR